MLLKVTKGIKHKRVISSALVVAIILASIAGAVFTAPVAVYALSAGGIKTTIASLIISLLLQTGVAPTNQAWLSQLNSSYGYTIESAISDGLLTETAEGLIDSGLADAIAGSSSYTDLGLDEIFTTTINDAGVIAGSGAVNIANTAIHVGKAGTIGAFAGAVAVGIGVGVLANKFINWAGNTIKAGISYFQAPEYLNELGAGSSFAQANYRGDKQYSYLLPPNSRAFYYIREDDTILNGRADASIVFKQYPADYYQKTKTSTYEKVTINSSRYGMAFSPPLGNMVNFIRCTDANDYQTKMNNYLNGSYVPDPLISPDIITPEGNATSTENDGVTNYPGIGNIIPEGKDMQPVDMEDYQDYVTQANDNTANGDTGQEVQGTEFDDLVAPLIVDAPTVPDQPIIPDNPVDVPTVPERPVVPQQPEMPDKPEVTPEQIDQALQGATTIDLRAIFPFCIPFDLYNLLLIFDTGENRRAPHITFTFPIMGWEIDVDLAPFDPVAGILRLLELILFIVGLAVATRNLIGAGGSG